MPFAQILPIADRIGTIDTGRVLWPNGVLTLAGRFDVTPFAGLNHPFNDPALTLTYDLYISYAQNPSVDLTDWLHVMGGVFNGSAAGLWGKNQSFPYQSWTNTGAQPRWYRAVCATGLGQTISYGISDQKT